MKQTLTKTIAIAMIFLTFAFAFYLRSNAQKVEKLIVYENFGGPDAGSSEAGILPQKWPDVHSDSGLYCR
jgi:hypothetical protein